MTWQDLPIPTDPAVVTAAILDRLTAALNPTADPAGWTPIEGSLEVALAEEMGAEVAFTHALITQVAASAVVTIGEGVFGLMRLEGTTATLPVTITVTALGAQVPAGFTVLGTAPDGTTVAFVLPALLTASALTVTAQLVALDVGQAWNGVPAGPLTVVTSTATVLAVAATAPSAGGSDPESRTQYLSRFVAQVALLSPGGVRAADLAQVAQNVPAVWRALALDRYDATTDTDNQDRTVSLFPVAADGSALTAAEKDVLRAAVEAVREVNFVIRVADPTYTAVTVATTVVPDAGADPAAVSAAVRAAVAAYLSPATWGSTATDERAWVAKPVRWLDLVRVVASVTGVAGFTALTLNGGQADVTLPGRAALPKAVAAGGSTVTVSTS